MSLRGLDMCALVTCFGDPIRLFCVIMQRGVTRCTSGRIGQSSSFVVEVSASLRAETLDSSLPPPSPLSSLTPVLKILLFSSAQQ